MNRKLSIRSKRKSRQELKGPKSNLFVALASHAHLYIADSPLHRFLWYLHFPLSYALFKLVPTRLIDNSLVSAARAPPTGSPFVLSAGGLASTNTSFVSLRPYQSEKSTRATSKRLTRENLAPFFLYQFINFDRFPAHKPIGFVCSTLLLT
jgi:hypothetical protein